jgi:alkaline phosphatase
MQEAIREFNRKNLDFIIELGDMKDMSVDGSALLTLGYLDEIESIFKSFDGPSYHVLGNHDMDCLTKEEFLAHTTNEGRTSGRSYYSFSVNGYRCIVLDANFNPDGSPYARGNFDWKSATIPASQLEWLDEELAKHRQQPTLIFIHQMLDSFSTVSHNLCVDNADEVRAILERNEQVLAVIQGHHHPGHFSHRAGIHYLTLNGMIEKSFPQHNSYAIVEVMPNGDILVEGFRDCPDRVMRRER